MENATMDSLIIQVKELCTQIGRTKNLLISTLLSERLELRTPLPVLLEHDGEQSVALSVDLNVYGWGPTEEDALDDFRQAVEDFYFTLKSEQLGDDLKRRFSYLASIISERRRFLLDLCDWGG
jgi:hypothetical protein